MAKQTGLGDNFYYSGFDISGDINSLTKISGGPTPWECTGINKSGVERLGSVRDGSIEFISYFNDLGAHLLLRNDTPQDVIASYFRGSAIGNAAVCCVGKKINYDPDRDDKGGLTVKTTILSNGYGVEWCQQATAGIRTDTGATNGASLDLGTGSKSFGLQAYLQVFAFTGTSATIKLQGSSDNGAGDAFADITDGAFTLVDDITSERIETARDATIERYIRVVTTGTFTNLQFAVAVARNDTEVLF